MIEKRSPGELKEPANSIEPAIDIQQKSAERYQRILGNLKNEFLFYALDTKGTPIYVSPSIKNILGYTEAEFSGFFKNNRTPALINDAAELKAKLSILGKQQPAFELEVYHKDGSCRQFVVNETPILDGNGKTIRVEGISRDITEKKKIEKKLEKHRQDLQKMVEKHTIDLRNSHKQLLDIIDFLPDPTYVVDVDRKIIAWNRALEKMVGVRKQDVIGQPFRSYITSFYQGNKPILIDLLGFDIETLKVKDNTISENNGVLSVERYLPGINEGNGGHVWITAGSILDSHMNLVGAVETIRDITQIKNVEKKIRKSEERLSAVMNNLPGMAYRIVKNGKWMMEFVSQGCRFLTGYEPSFFANHELSKFFALIHEDDIERVEKEFQAAMDRKRNFHAEYRIKAANGETKWVFNRAEGATFDYEGSIRIEGFITDFTGYKNMEQKLRNENLLLRSTMRDRYKFGNIIGNSKVMQDVYETILKAATTSDSVFIYGESGTGKELVSLAIHNASDRKDNKCVTVNCGAIPENLIESEFFGFKKGAFTGATADKKGFLETADGGTLFLDEIGEISLNMQVKLLRAIEGGGFNPIGSQKLIRPNLRIIAASNKNPMDLVKNGNMRSDFYFRIHVIPINLPPLRDRDDDIFLLVDNFLKVYSKSESYTRLSPEDLQTLKDYNWPGNVRELQNVIRRYIALRNLDFLRSATPIKEIETAHLVEENLQESSLSLKDAVGKFEKQYITEVLKKNRWQKGKTAQNLDVSRKTLFRKMKGYEII